MMSKWWALLEVLQQGKMLAQSATWKNRQAVVNALVGVLSAGFALAQLWGIKIEVSQDDLVAVAGGVGAVVGVCNTYFTMATSDKVGMPVAGKAAGSDFPDERLGS